MKKISTLIGIFLLLLVAAYIVMQRPGERSISVEEGRPLIIVDSLAVERIEIETPASRVTLEKRGVEWFVQQPLVYRADQNAVASLIHQARSLRVRSVVSTNPEKHHLFQVDSTGVLVKLFEKGKAGAQFVLGKMGNTWTEYYARVPGSDEVALVTGGSSTTFNKSANEWRDRTIFSAPRELVTNVRFQYGDTTFVLALHDSVWTVDGDSTQRWAVDALLSSLTNLQADAFVDTLIADLPRLVARIHVAEVELRFHEGRDPGTFLVQSSASPQWFELQSWRAGQVLKRKKDLVASAT